MQSIKSLLSHTIAAAYKLVGKPLFFLFDPEFTHDNISFFGNILGRTKFTRSIVKAAFKYTNHPALSQEVAGLTFENPIGLAAGFDKDGKLIHILPSVGFGFAEVGTTTYRSYGGNEKPRLYRLKKSQSIIVNYGLKNNGVSALIDKLKNYHQDHFVLGVSVGKSNCKDTCKDEIGIEDQFLCLNALVTEKTGDYYTINISCPNTFGGEPFTTPDRLDRLLEKLYTLSIKKPVFLKMPINLPWNEFEKLLEVAAKHKVTGVIIGNLNKNFSDPAVLDSIPHGAKGGLSGKPTWRLSNALISKTYQEYGKKLVIIGCGGIFSAEDAYEKIKCGATLVQLITGMIFEGPQLIGAINMGLVKLLKNDGLKNISEAIGKNHR
ncbi:quinone-dependent dihydroorotate dehydrogenase [Candidatus Peregrinibacteria bacterium]|nr:quinone-dependent dihydroorotate dehydrogenase [Candidatus Peregrinibacteria bacterium]